ncbi:MAG: DUF2335 domain-containing protein [Deltaproteobacteria bacterium]|nr:DUF2335 domain-containing protein [Deltaproteobacteria bacterium]
MSKKKKRDAVNTPVPTPNTQGAQIAQISGTRFAGPIPPPDLLKGYDDIIPGAAERILRMAEEEAAYAHRMNQLTLELSAKEVKRGQVSGFGVAIAAFIVATVALFLGLEKAAMTIGGTTIVGLVTVFVTGRKYGAEKPKKE